MSDAVGHLEEDPEDVEARCQEQLQSKLELVSQLEAKLVEAKADIPSLKEKLKEAQRVTSESFNKRLQDIIRCSICNHNYSQEEPSVPVSLDCKTHAHTFCRLCLLKWKLERGAKGEQVFCPTCKAPFPPTINKLLITHPVASCSRKRRRELDLDELEMIEEQMTRQRDHAFVWDAVVTLKSFERIIRHGFALLKNFPSKSCSELIAWSEVLQILRLFPQNQELQDVGFVFLNHISPCNLGDSAQALFAEMRKDKDILPRICPSLIRLAKEQGGIQALKDNFVGKELMEAICTGANAVCFTPDVLKLTGMLVDNDEDVAQVCSRIEALSAGEINEHCSFTLLKALAGPDKDRARTIFSSRIGILVQFLVMGDDNCVAAALEEAFDVLDHLGAATFTAEVAAEGGVLAIVNAVRTHKKVRTINMVACEWLLAMVEKKLVKEEPEDELSKVKAVLPDMHRFLELVPKYKKEFEKRLRRIVPVI